MRPLRFLLLLVFFIALPIVLTCWTLFCSSDGSAADSFDAGYTTRSTRLRALFSFSTPSSLFPPSAVISLTNDNSTFFLARPAAFGPSLPSRGLSGQLWVGKGFGDDALLKEENLHNVGWELGCSDVPGWEEEASKKLQHLPSVNSKNGHINVPRDLESHGLSNEAVPEDSPAVDALLPADDGTDDYLHRPLPDSNPAAPGQPGEPANADPLPKAKAATHADIESLQESADIAGKIVMLSRGGCGFLEKVKWAQRRGGIALIVGDNERGGQLTIMYAKGDTSNVTIPAVFTSYTSAHLLSSLVPPEVGDDEEPIAKTSDKHSQGSPISHKGAKPKLQGDGPVFTSTKSSSTRPTIVPAGGPDGDVVDKESNWMDSMLSKLGLGDNSPFSHAEDSRRPPSSGNIDWILVEDWDDDLSPNAINPAETASKMATTSTSPSKPRSTSTSAPKRAGADDFVIGVQDWRDTDLVAPKPTTSSSSAAANLKDAVGDTPNTIKASSDPGATLKGGSITPGSEKKQTKATKRKRYTGRQIECVVCLEEYVDGESRVMSLPCGHEFHAECITPWLVNRRRTCPICKGDVVRSLAHANTERSDEGESGDELTSDDVQDRVAQTANEEPSAAIPIPSLGRGEDGREDVDEDIERGHDVDIPLRQRQSSQW
ncbi:hypothetical protein KCU88_g6406, partial [Aureobasidium melanogenum]